MNPSPETTAEKQGFAGAIVASFESRMAREMEELITRHGGVPRVAPSMREVPLTENEAAFEFFEKLRKDAYDLVILMTGVGTKTLLQALATKFPLEEVLATFKKVPLLARGPKPVKVLSENGLKASLIVPEPNTWREVLATLDSQKPVKGLRVAIQEYGVENPEFTASLLERGAKEVASVKVYQWDLPEDRGPLTALIEALLKGEAKAALFTSTQQVRNVLQVAQGLGRERELKEAFRGMVVGSVGPLVSEGLREVGLSADVEPTHPKMGFLVKEMSEKFSEVLKRKAVSTVWAPSSPGRPLPLTESLFLKACRKEPTSRTPLWIMRQAGRYLPQYRAVRSKVSFLELCKTPDLACQVTVEAQEALGVDAAILFADILLIAEPLGFQLEFAESGGPVIRDPFRSEADLKRLREVDVAGSLGYVLEALARIRSRLKPDIPLIGFAGAPFTLASYLVEGGGSKDHAKVKALLREDALWDALMRRLVAATVSYLNAQAASGAQALQLFDSWVGILSPEEFKTKVLPYLRLLIGGLKQGIPIIYFGTQTAPFFPLLKETGASVIGVDWRQPLEEAWKTLGDVAIQGNLDPEVLLTDPSTVKKETEKVLKAAGGRPGHIFNLGHGILPQTPMDNVKVLIETVKNWKTN